MTVAISLKNLQVTVGTRCLLDIPELTIHAGEKISLVGPNGAGKSTFIKTLSGFAKDATLRGQIKVLGYSLLAAELPITHYQASGRQWQQLRARIGQVMQGLHLVPRLSARDNVILGALARLQGTATWRSWCRLYPSALQREADSALAEVGMTHRAHTRADQLSGGERQKISLARLRLQNAELMLVDEPTAALDPQATEAACRALMRWSQQATLISVVHRADLLPLLATRVLGVRAGQIMFDLPLAQVTPEHWQALYLADPDLSTDKAQ